MSKRDRSNKAVFQAIQVLSRQFKRFTILDIARVSTYSPSVVIRAIRDLEASEHVLVDRSAREHNRTAILTYTILKEMDNTQ
jgi:DNA-binding MarR family transcriptional regulator